MSGESDDIITLAEYKLAILEKEMFDL